MTDGNPLLTPLAEPGSSSCRTKRRSSSRMLTPPPRGAILDACASPGGKTTAMAAAMENRGLIVATDVRGRRVDLLARTVAAAGATLRARRPGRRRGALPFSRGSTACSSSALLRSRHAPARSGHPVAPPRSDLAALGRTQARCSAARARSSVPGGRLVYATCSSEPEENEAVVSRFSRHSTQDSPVHARERIPRCLDTAASHARRALQDAPVPHGLEAFFAAMLVRAKDLR